jgi:PAS domain S-box-containing protein
METLNYDVFDSFQDGVLILDKDHNIIFANRAIRELCYCEYGSSQIKCHELLHDMNRPCNSPDLICPHKTVFSTGRSINVTHIHVCPTGKKRIFDITCSPIKDEGGEVFLMAEILRDVTEIKMAEDTIRSQEEKLKENAVFLTAVLDGIGDAVVVLDRDYRIVSANEGYLKQTKFSRPEIIGRHCHAVSHHSDRPCYEVGEECAVKRVYETGRHHKAVHIHRDKQDNPVYVETNAYPIKDESGNVASVIETLTDVTEKVKLEQKLRESEERYRSLYNNSPDMLSSIDAEGTIIEANNTEAATLGYAKEELIGHHIKEILSPESVVSCNEKFGELMTKGHLEEECAYINKDGERIPVSIKAHAVLDGTGNAPYSHMVSRDLRAIKKAEAEKRALEAQLFQSQKMEAIGNLSAGIAHDFNNMLTGIMGYSALALKDAVDLEAVKRYVEKVVEISERAAELVGQILLIGKKLPLEKKTITLNQLIEDSLKMLRRVVEESIEIRVLPSSDIPGVDADPSQITQVLMNLIVNARDAMPGGGVVEIRTRKADIDDEFCRHYPDAKPGRYAVLIVSDRGKGIPEEIRDRIFEPFFTTKETGKGTGLGLAVTYSIVKAHGGWIQVYSEIGRGTEFKVFLPVSKARAVYGVAEKGDAGDQLLPGGTETVLLVDDEEIIRDLGELILNRLGYRVIPASNGKEAVAIYRERGDEIALVVLDKIMPVMDGTKTYRMLKKINKKVKVVISSGYSRDEVQKLSKSGVLGFLNKPYKPTDMARMVRSAIDSKAADRNMKK